MLKQADVEFLTEHRLCKKIHLSLESMDVCLSESVGEFFCRFHGGFISRRTENQEPVRTTEKRKSVESQK